MNFINRNEIANGVYFTNIKDSRFKTMKISVNIVVPLSVETASENALVGGLLVRSCKKYPDFTVLSGNGISASDEIGKREVATTSISPGCQILIYRAHAYKLYLRLLLHTRS